MLKFNALAILLFTISTALSAQNYKNINASEFKHLMSTEEGVVLDVRTSDEYTRGHIKNSTLIDISNPNFVQRVSLLQKSKPIYIYCLTGSRSKVAANYLTQQGYLKVYNLTRGIIEWQQNGFFIEQSAAVVASKNTSYTVNDFNKIIVSNSIVLIDFHAPWCAPCKKMSPIIDKIEQETKGKATVKKIDIEANKALQSAYNVQSIPGLVLFKNGEEVWKYTGVISYEDLNKELQKYL